jgi:uncharacterized protein YbjT (DUF2867 family)
MILVTGAAGKTGQAIIRALAGRGAAVRAFVYRPEQTARVKTSGAQEVVIGELHDEAAFGQAAQGVEALYHICSNMHPDEIEIGRIAIRAAQAAGVAHFVYHSVLHPQVEAMPHHWHKLRVEEMLFESGLTYTIMQPAAYMQNILAGWTLIQEQGIYRVPYRPEARLSLVDLEDVAAAAAITLTEPGHTGAIYELVGPDALSQHEVAAVLSRVLGRPVRAEQISIEAWTRPAQAAGMGAYPIETLVRMFRYYDQHGFWGNARVLGWLLNRPPTSFAAFVERIKPSKDQEL